MTLKTTSKKLTSVSYLFSKWATYKDQGNKTELSEFSSIWQSWGPPEISNIDCPSTPELSSECIDVRELKIKGACWSVQIWMSRMTSSLAVHLLAITASQVSWCYKLFIIMKHICFAWPAVSQASLQPVSQLLLIFDHDLIYRNIPNILILIYFPHCQTH